MPDTVAMTPSEMVFAFKPNKRQTLVPNVREVLQVTDLPAALVETPAVCVSVASVPGTNRSVYCNPAGAAPSPLSTRLMENAAPVTEVDPRSRLTTG